MPAESNCFRNAGTVLGSVLGKAGRALAVAGFLAGSLLPSVQAAPQVMMPGTMPQQPGYNPSAVFVQHSQPMQQSGTIDAEHSPNVESLLTPQYRLEVERRHSKLVITTRNVRRIAVTDSSVANYVQYSPTELSVVGLELGTTDLTLWFENEERPAIYQVTVVRDAAAEEQRRIDFGRLERSLATLFPNSNVYLIPVGAQVIVKGQAFDAEEATQILQIARTEVLRLQGNFNGDDDDNRGLLNGINGAGFNQQNRNNGGLGTFSDIVVNMLEVPGEYNIKLRVVIAELSRSQLRDYGINWNTIFNDARHTITGALGGGNPTLSGVFENGEISVILRWLATNGTATLLAEPTLVVMSGHSASILAGEEFAVPTIIGLGGGQNTTFRGVGTSMIVTPTVLDRDLIRLQIVPEFSAVNNANAVNGIPGTNVKRVQTTVELREGQTLALGGLISRQTAAEVSRIPLLGELPVVGRMLLNGKRASEDETELLVLVSPEIVRPMEPDEVPPLPNYYVTHPNDHDLWKYARTEGTPDTTVYQLEPYGSGATFGIPTDYSLYNPGTAGPGFMPGGGSGSSYSPQGNFGSNMQILAPQAAPRGGSYQPPQRQFSSPPAAPPSASPMNSPIPQSQPLPQYQVNPQMQTPPPATPLPPIPGQYQSSTNAAYPSGNYATQPGAAARTVSYQSGR